MIDIIKVRSATDTTVSLYDPMIPLRKTWEKRNAVALIERDKLMQAYFNTSLESCIRNGTLIIEDKQFLIDVGYINEMSDNITPIEMTKSFMDKMISSMPLWEVEKNLKQLSKTQISELVEYSINNYNNLKMDRIDLFTKYSGKNILKAIELYKRAQED